MHRANPTKIDSNHKLGPALIALISLQTRTLISPLYIIPKCNHTGAYLVLLYAFRVNGQCVYVGSMHSPLPLNCTMKQSS